VNDDCSDDRFVLRGEVGVPQNIAQRVGARTFTLVGTAMPKVPTAGGESFIGFSYLGGIGVVPFDIGAPNAENACRFHHDGCASVHVGDSLAPDYGRVLNSGELWHRTRSYSIRAICDESAPGRDPVRAREHVDGADNGTVIVVGAPLRAGTVHTVRFRVQRADEGINMRVQLWQASAAAATASASWGDDDDNSSKTAFRLLGESAVPAEMVGSVGQRALEIDRGLLPDVRDGGEPCFIGFSWSGGAQGGVVPFDMDKAEHACRFDHSGGTTRVGDELTPAYGWASSGYRRDWATEACHRVRSYSIAAVMAGDTASSADSWTNCD
jgi:hypothetical protein